MLWSETREHIPGLSAILGNLKNWNGQPFEVLELKL